MEILVVGAGIAGIGAGLALSAPGRTIKIIERDPAPPNVSMNELFDVWERKGATQIRHSHAFIAGLFSLIRKRHPDLAKAMIDAGGYEITFADRLPPPLRKRYRPKAGDEEMTSIASRRTTLEYVMRTYAETRPGVSFVPNTKVREIIVEKDKDGVFVAKGVRAETEDGAQREMRADVVIDASGRMSKLPDQLAELGIVPETEESPTGILYFTRFYRLHPGAKEPQVDALHPRGEDFGFIKYSIFPGDRENFSMTLQIPETETVLRQRILDPEIFQSVCAAFPSVARWIDPAVSAPVSKVFGMGNLNSVWRHWVKDGRPLIKNFFAIGDAAIRTNPVYGRGCCIGFVHAHLLADVLNTTGDPVARARLFDAKTEKTFRLHYDYMVRMDATAIQRAKSAPAPTSAPSWRARLMKSFAADALMPASRGDIAILRAITRAATMLDSPSGWRKDPFLFGRLLLMWAKPRRMKRDLYLRPVNPGRNALMALANAGSATG